MRVWIEIHVDDEILGRDPSRGSEAMALVDAIARCAEDRDARLSFRFREVFPRVSRSAGFLPELVERGHEVGAHAHGRGLAKVVEAIRSCGVVPEIAVPGLVQVGHAGRSALLRQAAGLGFRVVSDHCVSRAWAYEGLMGRWEGDVWVVSPTVRPPDWGLMSPAGVRLGVRREAIELLREREHQADEHGARWFGVAIHEHDFCASGLLTPRPEALTSFSDYLDSRVIPSLGVCAPSEDDRRSVPSRKAVSDRRVLVSRIARSTQSRVRERFRRHRPARTWLDSAGDDSSIDWLMVDERKIAVKRMSPDHPRAVLLLSHAGHEGGCRLGLGPFGLRADTLMESGYAIWFYDRSGTGDSPAVSGSQLTPGNPDHRRDWTAVLASARETGLPIVALTWSSGIVPVLAACAEGHRPDAIVDGEGPADRWSLVPPPPSNELAERDPWSDSLWTNMEAWRLLEWFRGPYRRLQGTEDHVHGPMLVHAQRMRERAMDLGLLDEPSPDLSGSIDGHPQEIARRLQRLLDRLSTPKPG